MYRREHVVVPFGVFLQRSKFCQGAFLPGGISCIKPTKLVVMKILVEHILPGFHYESISENAGGGQTGREPLRFIFRRFSGTGNEIPPLKISDKESLVESSDGDVLTSLSGILLAHAVITGPAINET